MRKITFLKTMLLAAVLLVGSGNAWGQTFILNEEFSGSLPTGWLQSNVTFTTVGGLTVADFAANTGKLTTLKLVKPKELTFSLGRTTNATDKTMRVNISTTTQTGTFTTIATYNHANTTSGGYITCVVDLSAYANSEVYLQFEKVSTTTSNWRIDWIKVTPAPTCTASNLAFANATVNKTTADAPFTVAATSLNATTAITYASNNTAVATVNATTGEVTLVGAGTAKITATQAAGTHSAVEYCASTAEYTLTVVSTTPTITITETGVPAMTAVVGSTDTETIHISGINLTGDIYIDVAPDNPDKVKGKSVQGRVSSEFSASVISITPTDGTVPSTAVTITYTPLAAGSHTARLSVWSEGSNLVEFTLNGTATWAPLPAPVATDASGINNAGFTANWEAVSEATEYDVNVYTKETTVISAADLFFSEYIEGGSNNKAIEIYNGTGASVDLSDYTVELYTNGANTPTSTLAMTGTLANGDVYVIYNSGSVAGISSVGDVANGVANFNGDDALVLKKNGTIIDSFGQVGVDPGTAWSANGVSTENKTLVRKPTVSAGRTASTSAFDPSVEWIQYNVDTFDYLGSHTMTATSVVTTPIAGSPFTATGETSKAVSGLSAETTYFYTVVAKNENVTSPASNEVSVTTGPTTGVEKTGANLNVGVSGNQIQFNASANQTVEVFNAVGQKLISRQTVDGLNTLTVSARGVVFVKLGDKVTKVIL